MNIIDILITRAEADPDKPAYIYLEDGEIKERILTFKDVERVATGIGGHLVNRNETACILIFEAGLDFVKSFWACLWAGKKAVPVSFPVRKRGFQPLARLIADIGNVLFLTNRASYQKMQRQFGSHPAFTENAWLLTEDLEIAPVPIPAAVLKGSDIAILQYTSGSTGSPKGVMVSHDNVLHNVAFIQRTFGLTSETVGVTWLPHFHDMGLVDGFVEPVFSGFTRVFLSPVHFAEQPARWLKAISRYRAHYSGGPNFAYDLCVARITDEQLASIDLMDMAYLYNGAEAIHQHTLENFARRFADNGYRADKMVTCYGMAETTLAVCFSPRGKTAPTVALNQEQYRNGTIEIEPDSRLIKVSSGTPPDDVVVKIVEPTTGRELGAMQIGEIWTQSPSVCQGYWKKERENADIFCAKIDGQPGSFLRTGDLGFLSEGALYITGRHKDLIIYHGVNYYPDDLEASLSRFVEIHGVSSAAFSVDNGSNEKIVIVSEVSRSALKDLNKDALIAAIKHEIFSEFALPVSDIVLVTPRSLPKSTSGKIQRKQCKNLYLANQLNRLNS
ncbi:MAG TPA: fatty acyl-AMP ligase [Saprospiraceae bacterium]|nr:fatty acyl-AMP ligase [Saprospiraceae bacterium]